MDANRAIVLLDTDVMIEVQRGRPGAARWLASLSDAVAIPAPVAWEMLAGARNLDELVRTVRFLRSFAVEQVDVADSRLATDLIARLALSSGLSLPDYLIAAQTLNRRALLHTFNVKHYAAVPGLGIAVPYDRSL